MKRINLIVLLILANQALIGHKLSPAAKVNPFMGTGGEMGRGFGNMFPGAAYPFGMIQLSPDNGGQGWQYCAGYHYPDSLIVGFSHTHLSGTGVGDYCDISLMPTTQSLEEVYFTQPDSILPSIIKEKGLDPNGFINRDGHKGAFDKHFFLKFSSKFSHRTEQASPGYYAVTLQSDQISVELTTAELAAMHRYHFPPRAKNQEVILNLGYTHNDRTTDASVTVRSPDLVTGYRLSNGKANDQRVYFALHFSRPLMNHQFFLADKPLQQNQAKGGHVAAAFTFNPEGGEELVVKVAISSASEEGALLNLKSADPIGWDFDRMRQATFNHWNRELGRVEITSKDPVKCSLFYTSLYHSYLAPYRFSDADGAYKGFNHQVEKALGYQHYTLLSLWDTFRAENPWLTLMQPKVETAIIHSMMAKYRQTGELPYWEISGSEGGSMIGYHAAVLIADALSKNLGYFDREELLKALLEVSQTERKGLGFYRKYHFVPTNLEKNGTVSKTLEYAYDDWCIAQVANLMGREDLYQTYLERSTYYKNHYDPVYHLMRGKNSDGSWYEPFHPRYAGYGNPHCVEGNTWQYSFFVPHDMSGLVSLMGGEKNFGMMLDSLFTQTSELLGEDTNDVTGLIGQYSHGNEPDHNSAYLFDLIGEPAKTQEYTNQIINTLYQNSPEGLCGNEDCGQMSAWYLFSSIGIYPVNPVDGRYYFGSPQFPKAKLHLPNGRDFTVVAKGVSTENHYIKSVKLNGKPLSRWYVTYDEIESGGELIFEMCKRK